MVGLYHDVVETQLLTPAEYARSTNEKISAVRKKIEVAQLMVEYLEFINAPGQYHIIRDLQLLFPLEELSRMLKKTQSNDEAEDLKVCVFSNILMRTSNDLGRFVRKIKDVMSTPYFGQYLDEQREIAEEVIDLLPPVGSVNSEVLRETVKSNVAIAESLERSITKALTKAQKAELASRPLQILEEASNLLSTIDDSQFIDYNEDDLTAISARVEQLKSQLDDLMFEIERSL